jgi:hypothetical protein
MSDGVPEPPFPSPYPRETRGTRRVAFYLETPPTMRVIIWNSMSQFRTLYTMKTPLT